MKKMLFLALAFMFVQPVNAWIWRRDPATIYPTPRSLLFNFIPQETKDIIKKKVDHIRHTSGGNRLNVYFYHQSYSVIKELSKLAEKHNALDKFDTYVTHGPYANYPNSDYNQCIFVITLEIAGLTKSCFSISSLDLFIALHRLNYREALMRLRNADIPDEVIIHDIIACLNNIDAETYRKDELSFLVGIALNGDRPYWSDLYEHIILI